MIFLKRINFIKRISLFLFIFSFLALVLSLWLQNALINFNYEKVLSYKKIENSKFFSQKINCSENIQECGKKFLGILYSPKSLGDCYIYHFKQKIIVNNETLNDRAYLFIGNNTESGVRQYKNLKPEIVDKDIEFQITGYNKNAQCIKNSEYYNLYKIFPFYYEFLYYLKHNPKTQLGAIETINPFIYGEVSISNVVKRFPINYIFKSFLYISVILMYLYWINYRRLLVEILNSKNNKFIYFGLASAFFLFFHVLLLGIEFDNKVFKLIRKLIIALFILSEIIAQFNLSIMLYKNRDNLNKFCNTYIINIKLYFVIVISLISFFIIAILLIYDLSSKVDYILEWNYFAGLLFYYLLSFMMWKKN